MHEKDCIAMVEEFIKAFNLGGKDSDFWDKLIDEEIQEYFEAVTNGEPEENKLKEMCDVMYVLAGLATTVKGTYLEKLVLDDMGTAVRLSEHWCPEAFKRVHESNMSKLGDDGKPIYNPDTGKVMKGPNYVKPDLSDLVKVA